MPTKKQIKAAAEKAQKQKQQQKKKQELPAALEPQIGQYTRKRGSGRGRGSTPRKQPAEAAEAKKCAKLQGAERAAEPSSAAASGPSNRQIIAQAERAAEKAQQKAQLLRRTLAEQEPESQECELALAETEAAVATCKQRQIEIGLAPEPGCAQMSPQAVAETVLEVSQDDIPAAQTMPQPLEEEVGEAQMLRVLQGQTADPEDAPETLSGGSSDRAESPAPTAAPRQQTSAARRASRKQSSGASSAAGPSSGVLAAPAPRQRAAPKGRVVTAQQEEHRRAKEDLVKFLRSNPADQIAQRYSEARAEGRRSVLSQIVRDWQSDPRCKVRFVQKEKAEESLQSLEGTECITAAEMRQKFGDSLAQTRMAQYESFPDPILKQKGHACDGAEERWYCVPKMEMRRTQTASRQLIRTVSETSAAARDAGSMVQGIVTGSLDGADAAAEQLAKAEVPRTVAKQPRKSVPQGAVAEFKNDVSQSLRDHRALRRRLQKVRGALGSEVYALFTAYAHEADAAIDKSGQLDVQLQAPNAGAEDLKRLQAHSSDMQKLLDDCRAFKN